jgi:hypothetical protein
MLIAYLLMWLLPTDSFMTCCAHDVVVVDFVSRAVCKPCCLEAMLFGGHAVLEAMLNVNCIAVH